MARLILNLALIRGEYTIALIPAVLRHEYVQSLEMSHKNPAVFVDFITDRIIATQMDLLRLLNVFVKPDEQNETCFNSAMARKRRMKSNNGGVNGGENERIEFRGAPKNRGYHVVAK